MSNMKNIALVAHDNKKADLLDWVKYNENVLAHHNIITTGTTGKLIENHTSLKVYQKFKSGPLGGDHQIGALIAENKIDLLVFLWDGLDVHEHIDDIRSLLRLATIYNIPTACTISTADMVIGSSVFYDDTYIRTIPDFSKYINRKLKL